MLVAVHLVVRYSLYVFSIECICSFIVQRSIGPVWRILNGEILFFHRHRSTLSTNKEHQNLDTKSLSAPKVVRVSAHILVCLPVSMHVLLSPFSVNVGLLSVPCMQTYSMYSETPPESFRRQRWTSENGLWRILDVIRSGSVPAASRLCRSAVTNWTDSTPAARPTTVLRTLRLRSRRRPSPDTPAVGAGDAETMIAGRCFTTSPAELRWLVRRLRTAGYRCSAGPPLTSRMLTTRGFIRRVRRSELAKLVLSDGDDVARLFPGVYR